MRTFYFVGGPTAGRAEEFFRRLAELGGPPPGWHVYPHASGDGKALRIVQAENEDAIAAHLDHFPGIYEATSPTEVTDGSHRPAAALSCQPAQAAGSDRDKVLRSSGASIAS
jgi:hypothetical protein